MMDDERFVAALLACTCEAEREALFAAALDALAPTEQVAFAQQIKSVWFDRYLNADLDQAFAVAVGLEQFGHAAHNTVIVALGLLARGDAERQSGRALIAMQLHERAGDLFLQADDRVGWARARSGWLVATSQAGRVTKRDLDAMEAVRAIFTEEQQFFRLAVLEQNIGLACQYLGFYTEALAAFDRGLALLTHHDQRLYAMLLGNKGTIFLWQGKLNQALQVHKEAYTIFMQLRSSSSAAIEEMYLSVLEYLRWHCREALQLADKAIFRLKQTNSQVSLALALIYRADILLVLNRFDEAFVDATTADTISRSLQSPVDIAYAMRVQAKALVHAGKKREALACLEESARIVERAGYPQKALPIALERIALLLAQGQAQEAREAALALLKTPIMRETETERGIALLLATEATLAIGKIALAQRMAQAVIKQGQRLEAPELLYRGNLVLARAAHAQGHLHLACKHYDQAFSCLQSLMGDLVLDQRSQFLEDKDVAYQEAIDVALTAGETTKALAYLEAARIQSSWTLNAKQDTSEVASVRDLRKRHRYISESLLTLPAESPAARAATEELKRLTRQIRDELEAQAQRMPNDGGMALAQAQPLPAVGPTTLAYTVLAHDLVIFVLRQGQVLAERVANGAHHVRKCERAFRLSIDTLTARLSTSSEAAMPGEIAQWAMPLQATLQRLWGLLIQPVIEYLPTAGEELVLIPHGVLHAMPLLALHDGQRYLAERWHAQLLPSCQALHERSLTSEPPRQGMVALGYSHEGSLPNAPNEAQHVAEIMQGTAWLGPEASVERLTTQSAGCAVLHIAAHGAVRLDVPNASFVQLADGPLHPTDVLELDLRGCRLVTLSACETGLGRMSGGDEQIGLARAFGFAGAAAVLSTLWRVDDASTFAFMDCFYRHLAMAITPTEALRMAQLTFLRDDNHAFRAHPYFWAGFQLMAQTYHAPSSTISALAQDAGVSS
jgi:CHAT domain-containing protein